MNLSVQDEIMVSVTVEPSESTEPTIKLDRSKGRYDMREDAEIIFSLNGIHIDNPMERKRSKSWRVSLVIHKY